MWGYFCSVLVLPCRAPSLLNRSTRARGPELASKNAVMKWSKLPGSLLLVSTDCTSDEVHCPYLGYQRLLGCNSSVLLLNTCLQNHTFKASETPGQSLHRVCVKITNKHLNPYEGPLESKERKKIKSIFWSCVTRHRTSPVERESGKAYPFVQGSGHHAGTDADASPVDWHDGMVNTH